MPINGIFLCLNLSSLTDDITTKQSWKPSTWKLICPFNPINLPQTHKKLSKKKLWKPSGNNQTNMPLFLHPQWRCWQTNSEIKLAFEERKLKSIKKENETLLLRFDIQRAQKKNKRKKRKQEWSEFRLALHKNFTVYVDVCLSFQY